MHGRDRQKDKQTDRQNYYGNTALCIKVHRAVKTGWPTLTSSYDVDLPRDVPFSGVVDNAAHLRGQMPQKCMLGRE